MIPLAVQFYDVVVFIHVISVVLAFGPTFAYAAFLTIAQKDGGQALPSVGRAILVWDRTANTIGMTVILLSGIYLASDGPYDFSSFFVSWGFVAILILFGLTHGFFIPRTREAVQLAERDLQGSGGQAVDMSPEFNRLSERVARVGTLAGLLIILTVYVMTAKPFL